MTPAPAAAFTRHDRATTPSTVARTWRIDAAMLGFLALVLRLPAYFAPRSLIFDDGVYGMSAVAMRNGGLPFRDVFSSQGPLHLPLLYLADLIGLRTLNGTRVLPVAMGIIATIATYAIARRFGTRPGAWLTATLFTTSGSVLAVTGPITSDAPAVAFTLLALLAALRYRSAPSTVRAVTVGVLAGAGLATKVVIFPVGIPIAILMLSRRRWREVVIGGVSVLAFAVLAAVPWGLGNVWDQSIDYHRNVHRTLTYRGNAWKVLATFVERNPAVLGAACVAIILGCILASGWPDAPEAPIGGDRLGARYVTILLSPWIAVQFGFFVLSSALWKAHVVHVVIPVVLLVAAFGVRLVVTQAAAVVAVLLLPLQMMHVEQFLWPQEYRGVEAQIVAGLRALPPTALVISDEPGLVWRAERDTPIRYVDTSLLRIEDGRITTADVARDAADPRVCAVVAWGPGHFARLVGLPERLVAEGFVRKPLGSKAVYYSRPKCDP